MSALAFFMLCVSFAAVPLYKIFCQRTGYGGTPKLVINPCNNISSRIIKIRFNADVHMDLPWSFKPLQQEVVVNCGQTGLAFYEVENLGNIPFVGIAVYNVTPEKAGPYFNKIHCFCFEEQTIMPHIKTVMPVQFYIDPAIDDDLNLKDVQTITLSYTFFYAKDPNILQKLGLPSIAASIR